MKIFYGCSDFTSFAHLPSDIRVMISAATVWKYGKKPIIQSSSRFRERFLDSGGFGFNVYGGGYPFDPSEYLQLVNDFRPNFFATMDYPCEPYLKYEPQNIWDRIDETCEKALWILKHYTGTSLPVPVVQGWELEHYDYCIHRLEKYNAITPYMAVGSVCMRKRYEDYSKIVEFVYRRLRKAQLHFFGLKSRALSTNNGELQNFIYSIDTCAWLWGRDGEDRLPKTSGEKMARFARYRKRMDEILKQPYQLAIPYNLELTQKGRR